MAASNNSALKGLSERSGVFRGEDGLLYIPGTKRSDGSYRKPIRVKEGYIPQDEQPAYENKGVKWQKERPACPGLYVEPTSTEDAPTGNERNRKKKEARKKAAERKLVVESDPSSISASHSLSDGVKGMDITDSEPKGVVDAAKRLKNLRKRLAQINSLKEKIDSGELKNPDPDQVRKVGRRQEVLDEISELESL